MLAYFFILLAVGVRFMPHPWTFTPIVGALLFFGARGSRRQMWVPLVILAFGDVLLTKFHYHYLFSWDQFIIWGWYAAILWLGTNLRGGMKPLRILGAALASSFSFFLLSNFAVWACWEMYPKTLTGLMACYAAALPFFRHATEGDLLFTAVFFAVPAVMHRLSEAFEGDLTTAA